MVKLTEKIYYIEKNVGSYVEEFLCNLNSKNTRTAYESDFNRFTKENFSREFSNVTAQQLETVDYHTIMKYRKSLGLDLANSTINRHINSIKAILLFLNSVKAIHTDLSFLQAIKELPTQSKEIPHMPIELVEQFIQQAKKERFHGELKANAIMFAVDSGLRLREIVELKFTDFEHTGNEYLLSNYGKGNKQNRDKISEEVYNELRKTYTENPEQRVFFPLKESNLKEMMIRIREKLNCNQNYSFHSLRKTSITYTHDMTGSLLTAQRKANHSSPNTTTRYIENRELEMTGYFSTKNQDAELYKKVEHEELLKALDSMPSEFLQILNNKLQKEN